MPDRQDQIAGAPQDTANDQTPTISRLKEWLTDEHEPAVFGYFGPNAREHTALLLSAVLATTVVYSLLIGWCYQWLYEAYASSSVVTQMLSTNPYVEQIAGSDSQLRNVTSGDSESQERVLLNLLQQMGLMTAEDTTESLTNTANPWAIQLRRQFCEEGSPELTKLPTCEIIIHVAQQTPPAAQKSDGPPARLRQELGKTLAAILANQIGAFSEYRDLVSGPATTTAPDDPATGADRASDIEQLESLNGGYGDWYRFGPIDYFRLGLSFAPNRPVDDAAIRNVLYSHTGLTDVDPLKKTIDAQATTEEPSEDAESSLTPADYTLIDQFNGELMSRLHAVDSVKKARRWISLCQGYEQFLLLLGFFWMSFLLLFRALHRSSDAKYAEYVVKAVKEHVSETDEAELKKIGVRRAIINNLDGGPSRSVVTRLVNACRRVLKGNAEWVAPDELRELSRTLKSSEASSRWLIVWLSTAIPAIGFVGTVRGISTALSSSDSIVRAQTVATQAAAITEVSGTLGIAFTTTLIALVIGLITSFLNRRQMREEHMVFDKVELGLSQLLEPAIADT